MDTAIMVYSGKNPTSEKIDLINWIRKKYPPLPRQELTAIVCEFLEWTTPAGRAKKAQFISFFKKRKKKGLLSFLL